MRLDAVLLSMLKFILYTESVFEKNSDLLRALEVVEVGDHNIANRIVQLQQSKLSNLLTHYTQ